MQTVPYEVELEQDFEKSFEKEPTSYSWGFFAYDDSPGEVGGGAGNFSWFDSKDELVKFLKKFPLLAHSAGAVDTEPFLRAAKLLAQASAESFDQKAVDELNKVNSGVEQIQWFGQFNDLLTGETEFAQGLRKFFGASQKLTKSQIPEFAEFLRNWGH